MKKYTLENCVNFGYIFVTIAGITAYIINL